MRFSSSHFDSLLLALDVPVYCPDRSSGAVGGRKPPATPQPTPGQKWYATVGAQSNDKGRQALAFLPNEIWIHAGDSITWTFDVDEIHTVTFIPDEGPRPFFQTITGSATATFDGSTTVSSPGQLLDIPGTTSPAFVKGDAKTFTVNFPTAGNFKQVCLFHQNMTGVVHVLPADAPLPHNQDFYDRQAADQRRDLLSDRDGRSVAACGQCAAQDSLKARVVTAGTGEISATAGGTQTLAVMRFLADQIIIRRGDTVEWTNQNPVEPHTVTFGNLSFVQGTSPFPPTYPWTQMGRCMQLSLRLQTMSARASSRRQRRIRLWGLDNPDTSRPHAVPCNLSKSGHFPLPLRNS